MNDHTNTDSAIPVMSRRQFSKLALGTAIAATFGGFGANRASAASFSGEELIYMTASELLPLFRSRKLSPVEVLQAQIARYEAVNDKVNCVTYTHFDAAMAAARESEKLYMNGTARALEGITCAVKDEHHDDGWTVTQGSILLKDNVMSGADPIVKRLKAAGAVLPIQTTTPEFYLSGVTWSKLWGVTRNPWNLKYSVGGSSGGSGAALASGLSTIATGSDMGGSIRIPAHFNGLFGFKPPTGRVPTGAVASYFLGTGPLARGFEDMTMLQNIMAGADSSSPATMPKLEMPLDYPDIKGMRIAYVPTMGLVPLDEDTKAAMRATIERLEALGAIVEEVEFDPGFKGDEVGEIFSKGGLGGPIGGGLAGFADRTDKLTDYAAAFVKKAASGKYNAKTVVEFENYVVEFSKRLSAAVFDKGFEAIVAPTMATPHVPADYDISKGGLVVQGKELHPFSILALTVPWNFLNWCPVIDAPAGISSQGVPIGAQIIGKPYEDLKVFQIAHAYAAIAPRLFQGELMPDFRG